MRKLHAIDLKTGLGPVPVPPASGSPWDDVRVAGSNCYLSYTVAGGVVYEHHGGLDDPERHQLFRCSFIGHCAVQMLVPLLFLYSQFSCTGSLNPVSGSLRSANVVTSAFPVELLFLYR